MSWNQCHCEDYQILIPMTIHGSKLKLEWLRYHENRDDALIDAPLTSESHNFWSNRWIFKFHTFSETGSQNLSKGVNINLIRGSWRLRPYKGRRLEVHARAINSPGTPQTWKDFFLSFCSLLGIFPHIFPSFKHKKHTKKHPKKKTHQNFLILLSSPKKHNALFSYPIFFSLVLHFGFGV